MIYKPESLLIIRFIVDLRVIRKWMVDAVLLLLACI